MYLVIFYTTMPFSNAMFSEKNNLIYLIIVINNYKINVFNLNVSKIYIPINLVIVIYRLTDRGRTEFFL